MALLHFNYIISLQHVPHVLFFCITYLKKVRMMRERDTEIGKCKKRVRNKKKLAMKIYYLVKKV